jgi:DNA-binding LacI/PurR family transcriptional regulator
VAFGAQSALVRSGRTAVAVTGYDNTYISKLDLIGLTSIEQNETRIADVACELLTNADAYEVARGSEFLVEPQLVIRKSSSLN